MNFLLLLCSCPTLFASFKAFWHTQPHRYHLSKKSACKHPAFLCLVVCGQRGAGVSRGWRALALAHPAQLLLFVTSTRNHAGSWQLRVLRRAGAVEKLCLGLPWVQSPLGGSRRQLRSASTSRGCSCSRSAGSLLSPYLLVFVEEGTSCLAGMVPGLHCKV